MARFAIAAIIAGFFTLVVVMLFHWAFTTRQRRNAKALRGVRSIVSDLKKSNQTVPTLLLDEKRRLEDRQYGIKRGSGGSVRREGELFYGIHPYIILTFCVAIFAIVLLGGTFNQLASTSAGRAVSDFLSVENLSSSLGTGAGVIAGLWVYQAFVRPSAVGLVGSAGAGFLVLGAAVFALEGEYRFIDRMTQFQYGGLSMQFAARPLDGAARQNNQAFVQRTSASRSTVYRNDILTSYLVSINSWIDRDASIAFEISQVDASVVPIDLFPHDGNAPREVNAFERERRFFGYVSAMTQSRVQILGVAFRRSDDSYILDDELLLSIRSVYNWRLIEARCANWNDIFSWSAVDASLCDEIRAHIASENGSQQADSPSRPARALDRLNAELKRLPNRLELASSMISERRFPSDKEKHPLQWLPIRWDELPSARNVYFALLVSALLFGGGYDDAAIQVLDEWVSSRGVRETDISGPSTIASPSSRARAAHIYMMVARAKIALGTFEVMGEATVRSGAIRLMSAVRFVDRLTVVCPVLANEVGREFSNARTICERTEDRDGTRRALFLNVFRAQLASINTAIWSITTSGLVEASEAENFINSYIDRISPRSHPRSCYTEGNLKGLFDRAQMLTPLITFFETKVAMAIRQHGSSESVSALRRTLCPLGVELDNVINDNSTHDVEVLPSSDLPTFPGTLQAPHPQSETLLDRLDAYTQFQRLRRTQETLRHILRVESFLTCVRELRL